MGTRLRTPHLSHPKSVGTLPLYSFPHIPARGNTSFSPVVICDESSMINDDLFDLLLEKVKEFRSKVIFVGDRAQLRPCLLYTSRCV